MAALAPVPAVVSLPISICAIGFLGDVTPVYVEGRTNEVSCGGARRGAWLVARCGRYGVTRSDRVCLEAGQEGSLRRFVWR